MTQSLPHAFKCAAEGVRFALGQRNMRIDVCAAALATILGFVLRIDAPSWLAVILCIGAVLALEPGPGALLGRVELLLRPRLVDLIDLRHELVKLASLIDWEFFETEWAGFFPSTTGRPEIR